MASSSLPSRGTILVTGGAGYIGAHTALQLLHQGYKVYIFDNFHNSLLETCISVYELAGDHANNLKCHVGDLTKKEDVEKAFSRAKFDGVIHFAGLKSVPDSATEPLDYFENNLIGSINLYQTMARYNCKKLVFASDSLVYGEPVKNPCVKDFPLNPTNPYARTKFFTEEIARDIQKADPEWKIILLRYSNPVGAHESGKLGEDSKTWSASLVPYITEIRDYIHVMDLADGHVAALNKLFSKEYTGCAAYNLGTGYGKSVFEMIAAFERACGKKIDVKLLPTPQDAIVLSCPSELYVSAEKAEKELGWKAKSGIEKICMDQLNWATQKLPEWHRRESWREGMQI